MSWLARLLDIFHRPILRAMFALVGYDLDWEPIRRGDDRNQRGWRRVLAVLFCFVVEALVAAALIWLAWWATE